MRVVHLWKTENQWGKISVRLIAKAGFQPALNFDQC
jgi:hypothetical protein